MTTYNLMNFSLGIAPQIRSFEVGPYKIDLVENYDDIITQISENAIVQESIRLDSTGVTTEVIERDGTCGTKLITATVLCKAQEEVAILDSDFSSDTQQKCIWDLCLILTYITGRRVFLPCEDRRYNHTKHGEPIVENHEIIKATQTAWKNRCSFSNEKEKAPFWYFLSMKDTAEAQLRLLCGSVSLEIIQNIESVQDKANDNEALTDLLKEIDTNIENSNIDKELKNKFRSTIGNWGSANAQTKFKNFLTSYGIIEKDIKDTPLKRVRFVFNMRNGISHVGELRKPQWVSVDEYKCRTSLFIASAFIPLIVEEYINRKFKINEFQWPSQNITLLNEYIYKGTWHGENIETEEKAKQIKITLDNDSLQRVLDMKNDLGDQNKNQP